MERLILVRHAESDFNAQALVNGDVAVASPLTDRGRDEARRLRDLLRADDIDLCVTSEFERARETADLALEGRAVPRLVLAELNDPRYGDFEGRVLNDYKAWAGSHGSGDEPPGGGESRLTIVRRYVHAFRTLLERPERTILAVSHSLPVAYVLAATPPAPRVRVVAHARPYRIGADELRTAVERMDAWCAAPSW